MTRQRGNQRPGLFAPRLKRSLMLASCAIHILRIERTQVQRAVVTIVGRYCFVCHVRGTAFVLPPRRADILLQFVRLAKEHPVDKVRVIFLALDEQRQTNVADLPRGADVEGTFPSTNRTVRRRELYRIVCRVDSKRSYVGSRSTCN